MQVQVTETAENEMLLDANLADGGFSAITDTPDEFLRSPKRLSRTKNRRSITPKRLSLSAGGNVSPYPSKEDLRDDIFSNPSFFKHTVPRPALPNTNGAVHTDIGLQMILSFHKIQVTLKEDGSEVSRAELGNSAAVINMFVDGVTQIQVRIRIDFQA